ncbi:MAG: hypothetical protein AAFU61_10125 [Pseudomonadota bacterium]
MRYPLGMTFFETIDDVDEWLRPMGWQAFWVAVAPLELFHAEDRAHCDGVVADGVSTYAKALTVLKTLARQRLTEELDLAPRSTCPRPDLSVVSGPDHRPRSDV